MQPLEDILEDMISDSDDDSEVIYSLDNYNRKRIVSCGVIICVLGIFGILIYLSFVENPR